MGNDINRELEFDQQYFDTISKLGKDFFSDFLSERSHKRQASLLAIAVLTILFSFTLVTPVEGDLAGIKLSFTNIKIAPAITGLICFYLLFTYLLGVIMDWEYATYHQLPSGTQIRKVEEQIKKAREKEQKDINVLIGELNKLTALRYDRAIKGEEIKHIFDTELEEMEKHGASGSEIERRQAEHRANLMEFIQEGEELNKEYDKLANKYYNKRYLYANNNKVIYLFEAGEKFKKIRKTKFTIEIIFPSLIALFSIGSAIWATFFR